MKTFISHASEDARIAQRIATVLEQEGHSVFLDTCELQPADPYHGRLREQIRDSQLFLFLVSPDSVAEGRYTRTELVLAHAMRGKADPFLFPVLVRETPEASIPSVLSELHMLKPTGDLVAEVAAEVERIARRRRLRIVRLSVAAGASIMLVAAASWMLLADGISGGTCEPIVDPYSHSFIAANSEDLFEVTECCVQSRPGPVFRYRCENPSRRQIVDVRKDETGVWIVTPIPD